MKPSAAIEAISSSVAKVRNEQERNILVLTDENF